MLRVLIVLGMALRSVLSSQWTELGNILKHICISMCKGISISIMSISNIYSNFYIIGLAM